MNISCAICDELFTNSEEARITICGHIFHNVCLNEWLKRSKTCPQCRKTCLQKSIRRIYFNLDDDAEIDPDSLTTELNDLESNLLTMESEYSKLQNENSVLKSKQESLESEYSKLKTEFLNYQTYCAKSQEQHSIILQAEKEKSQRDYKELQENHTQLQLKHFKLKEKFLQYFDKANMAEDLKLKFLKLEKQYLNLQEKHSNTEQKLVKCKSEFYSLKMEQNTDYMLGCNYNLPMENPAIDDMLIKMPSYRSRIRQYIADAQNKIKTMEENPNKSFPGVSLLFLFIHCSLIIWRKFKH